MCVCSVWCMYNRSRNRNRMKRQEEDALPSSAAAAAVQSLKTGVSAFQLSFYNVVAQLYIFDTFFARICQQGSTLSLCVLYTKSWLRLTVMCTSYGDLFENLTLRRTLRQFSLFLKFTVTSTYV